MDLPRNTTFCQLESTIRSRGVFYGDDPFSHPYPALMSQISISALLVALLQFFLTPMGETAFVSQSIAGVVLGGRYTGGSTKMRELFFSEMNSYVSETIALFGCMLFLFLVGVKTDLSLVHKSGKKAVGIGFCGFFIPLAINTAFAYILKRWVYMDAFLHDNIVTIAGLQVVSSYHVVAVLLADLKLLNSEIGRIAAASSLVSGICSWWWTAIIFTNNHTANANAGTRLWSGLSLGAMILLVLYILCPICIWIVTRHDNGKPVKEVYIVVVLLMVLGCSFFGEVVGQHFLFGPMILGLAVPDGPPLGTALVEKLDTYVTGILLPIYFVVNSGAVNTTVVRLRSFVVLALLALVSFVGKVIAALLPSLYCQMPFSDSLSLGLIMGSQGIIEVQIFRRALQLFLVNEETYTIMVITIMFTTAVATPLVKFLYKPSRRYRTYRRRSIQHLRPESEFRIVGCIYHQETTPSLIRLLDLSNPTRSNPICFYILHLLRLSGRSSSLLIAHHPTKKINKYSLQYSNQSEHIVKAFRYYEESNSGAVVVNPYTAVSPMETMHDDVCELALRKRASLIIVPFHIQYSATHTFMDESMRSLIRTVNLNILRRSPCSVAIFVGMETAAVGSSRNASRHIAAIFFSGPDDREALAFAVRMASHPAASVTVFHFLEDEKIRIGRGRDGEDTDSMMIREFRILSTASKGRHAYNAQVMRDSLELVKALRKIESRYELIIVGRRRGQAESPLLGGITEWNEFPELGVVGDILVCSDSTSRASVLVVQQQPCSSDVLIGSPRFMAKGPFAVVDMPRDSAKVWPM